MTTDQQARTVAVTTPADREIRVERVFDAPRDLVFATFHDPELIPEWWDGTTVDKMDVRNGGDWRFVSKGEGYETAFRGTFREVTPPERSVREIKDLNRTLRPALALREEGIDGFGRQAEGKPFA